MTTQHVSPPKWKWGKKTVKITFDIDWLLSLAEDLNTWKSWRGWTQREDCHNWKRSPIARENRRESLTYGNCLSTLLVGIGRREMLKVMEMAMKRTPPAPPVAVPKLGKMRRST